MVGEPFTVWIAISGEDVAISPHRMQLLIRLVVSVRIAPPLFATFCVNVSLSMIGEPASSKMAPPPPPPLGPALFAMNRQLTIVPPPKSKRAPPWPFLGQKFSRKVHS